MRRFCYPPILIAVSAFVCLVGTRLAFAGGTAVPFAGSFSSTSVLAAPEVLLSQGVGHVMHMGLTTNSSTAVLSPVILTDACAVGWGILSADAEILTAANGDQLVLVSDVLSCQIAADVFQNSGTWHVTYGTGRFAGADGSGNVEGTSNSAEGTFVLTLVGEITY